MRDEAVSAPIGSLLILATITVAIVSTLVFAGPLLSRTQAETNEVLMIDQFGGLHDFILGSLAEGQSGTYPIQVGGSPVFGTFGARPSFGMGSGTELYLGVDIDCPVLTPLGHITDFGDLGWEFSSLCGAQNVSTETCTDPAETPCIVLQEWKNTGFETVEFTYTPAPTPTLLPAEMNDAVYRIRLIDPSNTDLLASALILTGDALLWDSGSNEVGLEFGAATVIDGVVHEMFPNGIAQLYVMNGTGTAGGPGAYDVEIVPRQVELGIAGNGEWVFSAAGRFDISHCLRLGLSVDVDADCRGAFANSRTVGGHDFAVQISRVEVDIAR